MPPLPQTVRPEAGEYDPYYGRYIALVPDGDVVGALAGQLAHTIAPLRRLTDEDARQAYAPGKWTIAEVIGHVCDVERVMAYRALRIARGDTTPLAGFDENAYTPAGEFDARPFVSLLDELEQVRRATVALLAGLPASAWTRTGTVNAGPVSVRALAWIIAGHERHHSGLFRERYGVV